MKKYIAIALSIIMVLAMAGCGKKPAEKVCTIESGYATYYEMSDGTWSCNDNAYQYRLEISGRMPNAAADSTFVYLSNIADISFEQAWKAAGLSSNSEDYFDPGEAVLVEWIAE